MNYIEVIIQIIADLQAAIPDLPEKTQLGSDDFYRATKGAAHTLLGKTYLYMASPYFQERYSFEKSAQEYYTMAAEQFKSVIDKGTYDLEPVYDDIWLLSHEREPFIT